MRPPGRPPLPSDAGHGERRRADGGGNRSRLPLGDEASQAGSEANGREEGGALVEEPATYVFLMGTGPEEPTDGKRAAPERRRQKPRLPACGRGWRSSRRDWRAARRRGSGARARDEAYRMEKLVNVVIKYNVQVGRLERAKEQQRVRQASLSMVLWQKEKTSSRGHSLLSNLSTLKDLANNSVKQTWRENQENLKNHVLDIVTVDKSGMPRYYININANSLPAPVTKKGWWLSCCSSY